MSFRSVFDYLALPVPEVPWWIEGLAPIDGLLLLTGSPKSGKTQLALTMATGLLCGWETVCGFPIIHRPKRIAFLQADTPRATWHARLRVLTETHGVGQGLFVADALDMPFPFDVRNLMEGGSYQWLAGALNKIQPDILIVDTYRTIHLGDENDGQDANRVLGALRQANNHKSLWILHHLRKLLDLTGTGDPINDIRGSSVMIGAADIIGQLKLGNADANHQRHGHLSLVGRNIPSTTQKVWMEGADPFLLYPTEDPLTEELDITKDTIAANPGVSQRELARRVAVVLQCSEATARRRVAAVIGASP